MSIKIVDTYFPNVKIIEPQVFKDNRGSFYESYNSNEFKDLIGMDVDFVQDNHSSTDYGTLRGMHYQLHNPQGKLIRVIQGNIFDVVVDLRRSSPTFGEYIGIEISANSARQLWVPVGFAHGFYVLSDIAVVLYKMTDYWRSDDEHCLAWNDPDIGIKWPFKELPIQSKKDSLGKRLSDCGLFV
mgnify:CR=1 FL=1|tara:strand:- start:6813 stop:7364 length:552 start_codon:yes stop_codon:yes gene_type:complete